MKPIIHTPFPKLCTLLLLYGTLIPTAYGQLTAITLNSSSFNADLIAETGHNPQTVTSAPLDGSSGNNILYTIAFKTANSSTITSGGLPDNGILTNSGNSWRLSSYTSNNALLFPPQTAPSTANLTITTPQPFLKISLLDAAGYGPTSVSITLKFSDNTTSSYGTFSILDWFDNTPYVAGSLGRISRNSTVSNNNAPSTDPRLYQTAITLTTTDRVKNLTQVIITDNSTNNLSTAAFFALSGTLTATLALNDVDLNGQYQPATNHIDLRWAMIGGPSSSAGVQYQIQRSTDNATFSTLNTMDATTISTYSWSDNSIRAGSSYYYRIFQTSITGEALYSNVIRIQTPGNARTEYTVTQSGDLLYVNAGPGSQTQPLEYAVYNMAGQRFVSGAATGGNTFTVDLHGLTRGIYFIHLQGHGESHAIEFLH
jgi:trimeric autotransporter adhesin